jgi:hypothetical protein
MAKTAAIAISATCQTPSAIDAMYIPFFFLRDLGDSGNFPFIISVSSLVLFCKEKYLRENFHTLYVIKGVLMANTYTISLPDELKAVADDLANKRQLSIVLAELLRRWHEAQLKKVQK